MNSSSGTAISRRDLREASMESLLRLAEWLRLKVDPKWSKKHLAALIRWRITRDEVRNRH